MITLDGASCFVTAVDSCGGIGEKEHDVLRTPPETVGYYTARTVLLEILATGARPAFASISACNGPDTAERLLEGIKKVLESTGGVPWVMSTEKNMPTVMTAMGISMTGTCGFSQLRVGKCRAGDMLCCAGMPLVGPEILEPEADIFNIRDMDSLLSNPSVGSILPVGSRGIAAEAMVLAKESGLAAELDDGCGIDFMKSAGPSSCVLFSVRPRTGNIDIPYTVIGKLK